MTITAISLIDHGPLTRSLCPLAISACCTFSPIRDSTPRSPGYIVCGNGDAGKLRVDQRGASIACWTFMSKVYDVEKRLNCAHELIVSSGTSHQSVGLAILHDERGCQCTACTLATGQGVRFPRNQGVVIAPAIEDKSQVGHHDARSPTAVKAGHETDHVAITVDDGDIARIAVVAGVAVEVDNRILEQRRLRSLHEFFRVPGTQF